jgi:hypothetical protein
MSTDYRRKAKHLRYTSNAFFTLAGLFTVLGVLALVGGHLSQGLIIFVSSLTITSSAASIRMSSKRFARLGASQSRMTAWNRRA